MQGVDIFVVFGAAVRSDGSASRTLLRRTLGAWTLSGQVRERRFVLTGGQGRHGRPEAYVMRDLLMERGVPEAEIELDDLSRDTLESALRCAGILSRRGPLDRVVIATSRYHAFRCWLLFRLLGVEARVGAIPSDRSGLGLRGWLYYCLRECLATPWDVLLLLVRHRGERSPPKHSL